MTDVKQIISALPKLSKGDRAKLRQALNFLDGPTTETAVPAGDDWLLFGLDAELTRRGISHPKPNPTFITATAPKYNTASARIRADMRKRMPAKTDSAVLLALGRVCARLLIDYMLRWSSPPPINFPVLLRNIDKLPEAFERAFPGYIQAGMLSVILSQLTAQDARRATPSIPARVNPRRPNLR